MASVAEFLQGLKVDVSPTSKLGKLIKISGVARTPELERIMRLPRWKWQEDPQLVTFTQELTKLLRIPGGTFNLWPQQAAALWAIYTLRGAMCSIAVGKGKALISLLAPVVVETERPLLMIPASTKPQTREVIEEWGQHFRMPQNLTIVGHEELGLEKNAELLWDLRPTMLIIDEAHAFKNLRSGRTRRVRRYLDEFPETIVVVLTGTPVTDSLHDWAHLARWALKDDLCPVPTTYQDLQQWADALDLNVHPSKRVGAGALGLLCDPGEDVQEAVARRTIETPGVVATSTNKIDVDLVIDELRPEVPVVVEEALTSLRTLWETPDGEALMYQLDYSRHVGDLALGFYMKWDPPAPKRWRDSRKAWHKYVRETIRHNRRQLDTPLQVWNECEAMGDAAPDCFFDWREVDPTFDPKSIPCWLSSFAIDAATRWLFEDEEPAIAWVEDIHFGEELAKRTGVPYLAAGMHEEMRAYARGEGNAVRLIASRGAHGTGKNLQRYTRHLVVAPTSNGRQWEQLLGRAHRERQTKRVRFQVFQHTDELRTAFRDAIRDAKYIQTNWRTDQKLLSARLGFEVHQ